jgi:uncharacterized protein YcfL
MNMNRFFPFVRPSALKRWSRLKPALSAAPLLATLLAAGCSSTSVNTVERAEPVGRREMMSDKRIITDRGLNRRVRVLGINTMTGPGGFLKVQVEVLNTTSGPETFNYRFEWFDENGMILEVPTSTSISKQIEGKESVFLVGLAPNERAKDFRLKLIENLR